MIIKFFEIKKKIIPENKFFLLYGNNIGLIEEVVKDNLKPFLPKEIYNYEEGEIIKNIENFKETVYNKSFFENEKLIIVSRVSDKIIGLIETIINKNIEGLALILTSGALEKKSKIRNLFEKGANTICIPFYEDNNQTLGILAQNFLKEKGISISQKNINLVVERCSGDRINLNNELIKIESYTKNKKNINTDEILKLSNLSENFSITELVDNCLTKNKKKTINILNENSFDNSDCIPILRIFLSKLKRLLKLQFELKHNNNLEISISNYKPPIFWKEKETVKNQLKILTFERINLLIKRTNEIELLIKKRPQLGLNIIYDFILQNAGGSSN
jgi:DNA polymerase-3 subunit delta